MAKPKITRIKAGESSAKDEAREETPITREKVVIKDKKQEKAKRKELRAAKKAEREASKAEEGKRIFILFRPFVALGRYLRDSWREIRQVRWPNRKATWKMVLAVLIYTTLFVVLISVLDLAFAWLFNLILGN